MSEDKRHIDNLFKEGLSGHTESPPREVWDNISNHLSVKKRTGIILVVSRLVAGILMLLGIGGGLMYYFTQENLRDNHLSPGNLVAVPIPEMEIVPAPDQSQPYISSSDPLSAASLGKYSLPSGDHETKADDLHSVRRTPLPIMPTGKAGRLVSVIPGKRTLSLNAGTSEERSLALNSETHTGYTWQGEKDTEPAHKRSKWQAGIMMAPNYSYRTLTEGSAGTPGKAGYNSTERGLMSIAGRITVGYTINDRFSIQSGLDFLNMGQSIGGLEVFNDPFAIQVLRFNAPDEFSDNSPSFHNSLGEIHNTNSQVYITDNHKRVLNDFTGSVPLSTVLSRYHDIGKVNQELYYIQIPAVLRYRLLNGDTRLVLSGGLGINLLAGNRVILEHQRKMINIGQTLGISSINLSGLAGIGLERSISKNLIMVFEPRFSHFINSVNPGLDHRHHPYAFSFYGGVTFRF
jgi:hypothetical protein